MAMMAGQYLDPTDGKPKERPLAVDSAGRVLLSNGGGGQATNGDAIDPANWATSYNYNGDGTINYIEITDGTSTYRRTYTYSGGQVSSITGWVKQ